MKQEPMIHHTKPGLMNPFFVYKKGSDVQLLWRKHGWTPPTEYRNDYEFAKNREGTK